MFSFQHAFYDRDDVALKGLAKFFKELAEGENQHAHKLIEYHNLRGGRVLFTDIGRPVEQEFDTPVIAMEFALKLEKRLNQVKFKNRITEYYIYMIYCYNKWRGLVFQSLLDLHQVATNRSDPHLTNYLESHFLNEQAETINKVAKLHTNLVRVGDGLGVFVFDKELQ